VQALREHRYRADTRIYSLPYQHFCLAFYTGLPVQSIAPVRREFLDAYEGEILLLEVTNRVPAPQWKEIRDAAKVRGVELGKPEAWAWAGKIMGLMIRAEVQPLVRSFSPDPGLVAPWSEDVARELLRTAGQAGHGRFDYALDNPAMFKGYAPMPIDEFWPVFFYRFVDPERRTGAGLNYAGRMKDAEARLLPGNWLVLRIPARAEAAR